MIQDFIAENVIAYREESQCHEINQATFILHIRFSVLRQHI